MRQLEGRGDDGGVQTKGLPTPGKYGSAAGNGTLATTPKAYNTDADAVDTGKKAKKEKKRKADDTPGDSAKKKSKKEKKEKKEKKSKD